MWNQVEKNPFLPKVLFIMVLYTTVESLTTDMFLQQSSGGVLVTKKQNKIKQKPAQEILFIFSEGSESRCLCSLSARTLYMEQATPMKAMWSPQLWTMKS